MSNTETQNCESPVVIKCKYRMRFRNRHHCGHHDMPPYLRTVSKEECVVCPYVIKE